ncbi:hypothetical protein EX30DRAFT_397830 [Ascodesmis nigricans]|uniref:RanBP2-type domain-containing protein n=1 Tax=Ascodesmis nigricans TaxID=341454 RepID=A0A4S2MS54_9PEZI|nr:hypothetical protein EX30DRAFT_397830 [Ascodesmis nigricans]
MPIQRRNAWNNPLCTEMRRRAPYYLRKPIPTSDRETFLAKMGNNTQRPRRVASMPNLRPTIIAREVLFHEENIKQVTGMTAEMAIADEDHENQASALASNDLNGVELLSVLPQQGNGTQDYNEEQREQSQVPFNIDQHNGAQVPNQGHELHGPETDEILFADAHNNGLQALVLNVEQSELQAGPTQFPNGQDIDFQAPVYDVKDNELQAGQMLIRNDQNNLFHVPAQQDDAAERQAGQVQFPNGQEDGFQIQDHDAEEEGEIQTDQVWFLDEQDNSFQGPAQDEQRELQPGQPWMTIDQLNNILGRVHDPQENGQAWFPNEDYEEIATIPDDLSYQGDSESEDGPAPDFSMQMDAYYFETTDFALDIEPTVPIPLGVLIPRLSPEREHQAILTNSVNADHHPSSPTTTNAASALTDMANGFDDIVVDYPNPSLEFSPGLTIMPPIITPDNRTGWYCCQCGRFHDLKRAVCGGCKLMRCGACAIMNAAVVEEKEKIKRETKGQWSCCECYTFNDAGARKCVACDARHCHQCIRIPPKPKKRTKDGRSMEYFERKEENYDGFMA